MDHNDRYIVELSRAAIFDDTPFRPEKDVNWEYIYEKSVEQKIAGLVFAAASKLAGENKPPDDILAKFNDEMFATIALTSGQNIEFARTVKAALEKNIRLIGLKGCIIRNIYPVPELRTMSDYDILTSPENLKDVRAFFENIGYGYGKDAFGCVFEKDLFYWEVFTTMGEEFRINTEKWDKYFFENTVEENGVYTVSPTAFLLHLIVHTGKHYVSTGAGIRNLMDIALYTAKYKDKIDFDLIKAACEEQ
ncbi:MAG: nucleotidyltransferase family protein, partial [Firmicutes bacterium]|nr:nucleotidyltransferase family protein [Bacillota bacterium]